MAGYICCVQNDEALNAVIDPHTTGSQLQEIATKHHDLWLRIALHPNAYPGLLDWLDSVGDAEVRQTVAQRRMAGSAATLLAPRDQAQWAQPSGGMPAFEPEPHQRTNHWLIILVVVLAVAIVAAAVTVVALVVLPARQPSPTQTTTITATEPAQPTTIPVTTSGPVPETILPPTVTAAPGYTNYTNDRFGYAIEYPSDFVVTTVPADDDGRVFTSPDGTAVLTVWAQYNVDGSTVASKSAAVSAGNNVSYAAHGSDWFIASWVDANNQIVYHKEYVQADVIYGLLFTCRKQDKPIYEAIITHLEKTFHRLG